MSDKTKIADLPVFDMADYLDDEEKIAQYLTLIMQEDEPALLTAALGDVARARGMTQLARQCGLARESLYRSLAPGGNPSYATVSRVMRALGLQLTAQPAA